MAQVCCLVLACSNLRSRFVERAVGELMSRMVVILPPSGSEPRPGGSFICGLCLVEVIVGLPLHAVYT